MDQHGTLGGVKSLLACLMIGCLILSVLAVLWQPGEAHASPTWETLTIDSATPAGTRSSTSLAFDASGNPGIAYYDAATPVLKYAHWNGLAWVIETIAGGANVGLGCSLAFDPSGNPAISYVWLTVGIRMPGWWQWAVMPSERPGSLRRLKGLTLSWVIRRNHIFPSSCGSKLT